MMIGTIILMGLMRALAALPLRFHYACAGFLSWLLKDVIHYRRDVVMTNLSRSFPDKKYKELKGIEVSFYKHFGRILAETIWFGGCRNPERLRREHLVEYKNIEVFEKAYSESKGVVVMNTHFGNWELMGGCLNYDYREGAALPEGLEPNDIVFVHKPLKNPVWNEVMKENRCAPVKRLGYKSYVSSGQILRHALKNRDRKLILNFPTDQCPYSISRADETVEFLHQETRTMIGAASIARKLGYSVLYMCLRPVRECLYEWEFTEICKDASAMTQQEIMSRYYELLQKVIEEYPWAYLWTHKRWK